MKTRDEKGLRTMRISLAASLFYTSIASEGRTRIFYLGTYLFKFKPTAGEHLYGVYSLDHRESVIKASADLIIDGF